MEDYESLLSEYLAAYPNQKCDTATVIACVRKALGNEVERFRQYDEYLDYIYQSINGVPKAPSKPIEPIEAEVAAKKNRAKKV